MNADFRTPVTLPPVFDGVRAKRIVTELGGGVFGPGDGAFRALVEAAAGNSPYLARLALREAQFLARLPALGLQEAMAEVERAAAAAAQASEITHIMHELRVAKRRAALVLALADIGGLCDLAAVMRRLTRLADISVKSALQFLLTDAAKLAGLPMRPAAALEETAGLIILAMGKMGAFELNYSSDIDLIAFYDEERFPFARHGDKRGAAVEIVKGLLRILTEATVDGYVFRVDLRLRPDAGATQIAISTGAAELYYESMGQNWERAAWIKARAAAGDPEISERFLKTMAPFVWRKNLDYAAIEDIHSIKRQIHTHAGHARVAVAGHNIKLGRGGIREIEFFAQTQQLILGGREADLRGPATLDALAALEARHHISREARDDLTESYQFLRTLEHRLQMVEDDQTHSLPKSPDGLDHIARFMGFTDTAQFEDALLLRLTRVQGHYARLFEREAPLVSRKGSLVFTGVEEDPETLATLAGMGFARASDISAEIRIWHHGRIRATRSARAREILTRLMPALLDALAKTADPDAAFAHFDRFLSGLPAGVQVFSLFLANPRLLDLVAEIAGSAPRLAEYLGRHPGVLDALIDPQYLLRIPDAAELRQRFTDWLTPVSGFEASLDAARRFAKEEMFRIGVQVIQGLIDAEHAGAAYTAVAETVIAGLGAVVESEMAAVHGRIPGGGFAVVAQGKLGGREMTATSDLDLVFIYAHAPEAEISDGGKPLAPAQYFARAAQRFIAALTAMTAEGGLYEVDMRLRPSGNQGPVAVRLDTFADYHRGKSWTWERLALTRARVLSGPEPLRAEVEQAIRAALTRPQDHAAILRDSRAMRGKLAAQFPVRNNWDIKFAPGGLVDIEFVAQALQLIHAPAAPRVLDQNTVVALERLAEAGALAPADASALIAAARLQHGLTQLLRIAVDGAFAPKRSTRGLESLLMRDAQVKDFPALERRLSEAQSRAHEIFNRLIAAD